MADFVGVCAAVMNKSRMSGNALRRNLIYMVYVFPGHRYFFNCVGQGASEASSLTIAYVQFFQHFRIID